MVATKIDKGGASAVEALACYHCQEALGVAGLAVGDKWFCCTGCKTVYQFLSKHDLCNFYALDAAAGKAQRTPIRAEKFAFLDQRTIAQGLVEYSNAAQTQVSFYVPQMHCSSCLWLLERLHRVDPGIVSSRVNFQKKEVTVLFQHEQVSLRGVAEILSSVGYEPHFSMQQLGAKPAANYQKKRVYQLGVAGFCFANIMLLSFPDYLGLGHVQTDRLLSRTFQWFIFVLSLPVLLYSAQEFFRSGWASLKQGVLNIDAPIALAILITFLRSAYELGTGAGAGYLDSMAGIVLFMLVGRVLQDRTTQSLSFDRDYTSYFPIAVGKKQNGQYVPTPLAELRPHDQIIVYNNEIIPADCLLVSGKADIDYSFVTGESLPEKRTIGDFLYAGGRQTQGAIEMVVVKEVTQSYLTRLWQHETSPQSAPEAPRFVNQLSKYFSLALFSLAGATALYWYFFDDGRLWQAVTAVLIVACPCSLLLSSTFTNGYLMRYFDRAKFFVRNALVIEQLAAVDTIVFDKTGTLTTTSAASVSYVGSQLSTADRQLIASVAAQSAHPLSRAIAGHLHQLALPVDHFEETIGAGCAATISGHQVVFGSAPYVTGKAAHASGAGASVWFKIDEGPAGRFDVRNGMRPHVGHLLEQLRKRYQLWLLSGDVAAGGTAVVDFFAPDRVQFGQLPHQKLAEIEKMCAGGSKVMMVGDGLNDAGALRLAHVGVAVTEQENNFCPASKAILHADQLGLLGGFLQLARWGKRIVIWSFVLSLLYNVVGLSFAVSGLLQPMVAAILMPASSISIVLFTWLATAVAAKRALRPTG
jgi:P-type Cu+ transporter